MMYWVTFKLPQIFTGNHATFQKQICKITVQIFGNFWVTQYLHLRVADLGLESVQTHWNKPRHRHHAPKTGIQPPNCFDTGPGPCSILIESLKLSWWNTSNNRTKFDDFKNGIENTYNRKAFINIDYNFTKNNVEKIAQIRRFWNRLASKQNT